MAEGRQPPEPGSEPASAPAQAGDRPAAARRPRQPHLSGDLPAMFDSGPAFATAMRGYDRLQVDNYVAWAESELRAAQRLTTELVGRLAASEGELQRSRDLMARAAQDRELVTAADRVADLLRLAVQEATASAEVAADDGAQADDVLARAREEAEVVIRRARRLEARAAARLQSAERRLAEARTAEEQARSRAQEVLQEAADEHERLVETAQARLTETTRELRDLQQRRYRARELLRQLTTRVDEVLTTIGGQPAGEHPAGERPAAAQPAGGFAFTGNRAGPVDAPTERITSPHRARRA